MKKTIHLWIFCLIFVVSCSTDEDPSTIRLNSFEKSLIPYDSQTLVDFSDQDGEILSVLATARQQDELFASSSGSDPKELEQISNQMVVLGADLDFIIQVGKTIDGKTNFFIREQFEQQSFNASSCETRVDDLKPFLTELTVGEISYSQVFDFEICSLNEASDLELVRIIYSAERGIEYLEFENGDFLKQL